MGKATNMRSWETCVIKAHPDRNYGDIRAMAIVKDEGGVSGNDAFGYLSFARPFPLGAKILSAQLSFHTWAMPESGDHTIYLRRVNERFAHHRVTWNTRPSVGAVLSGNTVTKSGPLPTHEEWVYDVTADLQGVSDGEPWYGWRITTDDTVRRHIVAQEAEHASRGFEPTLTIEWSDQPDEPASLTQGVVGTSKPALSFEYLPIDEDATLQQVHVQTSATTSFAAPSWDSGEQDWTEPTVYLGDLGYPGAAVDELVFWRLRVADQGGWSGWSAVAAFRYAPEADIIMTQPAGMGPPTSDGDSIVFNGYITSATPTIAWEVAGQESYQVTVAEHRSSYSVKDWIWNSGRVYSTVNHVEIPKGVITREDIQYRIIVRVYDEYDRVSVANDSKTYSGARIIVEFTEDPALTDVQNVRARQLEVSPDVEVAWTRVAPADEYMIIRDRENDTGGSRRVILDQVDAVDIVQPDGSFKWVDKTAPPRTPFLYVIRPVEDGKRGKATRGEWIETRLDGIWLVMPTFSLAIVGDEQGDWELPEQTTAHQVVGASVPTIIREAHQGYQMSLEGLLVQEGTLQPWLTAVQKRDRFLEIKNDPRDARLVMADMNVPVKLANLNVYPTPWRENAYQCSFDVWQSGEMWWREL